VQGRQAKESSFSVEKEAKRLLPMEPKNERKFFASFFQKRRILPA
jgi:hypothetical protein